MSGGLLFLIIIYRKLRNSKISKAHCICCTNTLADRLNNVGTYIALLCFIAYFAMLCTVTLLTERKRVCVYCAIYTIFIVVCKSFAIA